MAVSNETMTALADLIGKGATKEIVTLLNASGSLTPTFTTVITTDMSILDTVAIGGAADFSGPITLGATADMTLANGCDIAFGTGSGTKIGTGTTQKLGFFNATPVVRQAAITAPTGGGTVDTECRAAVASLITTLQTLGLTA